MKVKKAVKIAKKLKKFCDKQEWCEDCPFWIGEGQKTCCIAPPVSRLPQYWPIDRIDGQTGKEKEDEN